MFLVLVVDRLEAMADHGLTQEPEVCEFGEDRARIFESRGVGDEWYEMSECDNADDGDDEMDGRGKRPCKSIAQLTNEICLNHVDRGDLWERK